MTDELEAIEERLPWGLHDALLLRLDVDWANGLARMDLRVAMTESQDRDQLGQLTFGGLVFCAVQAPEINASSGYIPRAPDGLRIDCGHGAGHESCRENLPSVPAGSFLLWFFVTEWNRFLHVCARTLQFTWLENETSPRAAGGRALFPGEKISAS